MAAMMTEVEKASRESRVEQSSVAELDDEEEPKGVYRLVAQVMFHKSWR